MSAAAQRAESPVLSEFSPELMKRLDALIEQLIAIRGAIDGDHDLEVEDAEESDPPEDHDGT